MQKRYRYLFVLKIPFFFVLMICCYMGSVLAAQEPDAPGRTLAQQVVNKKKMLWITADHAKFKPLQQTFTAGPQVTEACLGCHTEAALQFHKTIHWTWKDPSDVSGKTGKAGLTLNNF